MYFTARVFELTGRVVRALRALARKLRRKRLVAATPIRPHVPYYRRHLWDPFEQPQSCMYCTAERTHATEDQVCAGVKLRRVSGLN